MLSDYEYFWHEIASSYMLKPHSNKTREENLNERVKLPVHR